MTDMPCSLLKNTEARKKLERNSIFLLTEDKDADYEFFIFIDNPANRSGFLKELHHCLCKLNWEDEKAGTSSGCLFSDPDHEKKLREWLKDELGNGGNEDDLITPLNWLKIAIEKYPYRLFVVINKESWGDEECNPLDPSFWYKNNGNKRQWFRSPFLYKRICWLTKNDFTEAENGSVSLLNNWASYLGDVNKSEKLKLWLHAKWIDHLHTRLIFRRLPNQVKVVFSLFETEESNTHTPNTIPSSCFAGGIGNANALKSQNLNHFPISFASGHKNEINDAGTNTTTGPPIPNGKLDLSNQDISYKKHLHGGNNSSIYSENISGANMHYPVLTSIGRGGYAGMKIIFQAIENALLVIKISDERAWDYYNSSEKQNNLAYSKIFFMSPENNNFSKADVLIVHQGIIDKKPDIGRNFLSLKDTIPFIIVTSGRGMPEDIPAVAKFMPFSSMENSIMKQYHEKFIFMHSIMKLARWR